jgi:hypothetical protein
MRSELLSQIETAARSGGNSVTSIPTSELTPAPAQLLVVGGWRREMSDSEGPQNEPEQETYNPWSVVNLVFTHLSDQGLHPILGEGGDPGPPARALLLALGITPDAQGNREVMRGVRAHLAEIRRVMFEED